jgi:hypothetical protein
MNRTVDQTQKIKSASTVSTSGTSARFWGIALSALVSFAGCAGADAEADTGSESSSVEANGRFRRCANEGAVCNWSGAAPTIKQVRYGSGTTFVTRWLPTAQQCSNFTFGGDPTPNRGKVCDIDTEAPVFENYFTECSKEGGTCAWEGGKERLVFYGVNGVGFEIKLLKSGVSCSNSAFGDPAPNRPKVCLVSASDGVSPAKPPALPPPVAKPPAEPPPAAKPPAATTITVTGETTSGGSYQAMSVDSGKTYTCKGDSIAANSYAEFVVGGQRYACPKCEDGISIASLGGDDPKRTCGVTETPTNTVHIKKDCKLLTNAGAQCNYYEGMIKIGGKLFGPQADDLQSCNNVCK